MLVEVCANSLESALNAQKAGADRIELCAELGVGGITPSYGLIAEVKKRLDIPIHVLIRPRSGHFTYSDFDFEVMKRDIGFCKEIGVDGIVSGMLLPDFTLDMAKMETLVQLTYPLKFTFHRAFDWVEDPLESLKQLEVLQVDNILTSGQSSSAEIGVDLLQELEAQSQRTTIIAGGGIRPENCHIFQNAGLKALHLSGTSFVSHINTDHKIDINSSKHLREASIAVTQTETIRQIVTVVK
ncbi:MAG: copper homeostasis protein CutC [Bacteroidota bacterium]